MTLVERMVVSPGMDYNVTWMKMDPISQGVVGKDINITAVTEVGDPTTTVTLTLDPLRFGSRGTYICIAEFNITKTQDAGDDTVEYDIITFRELHSTAGAVGTHRLSTTSQLSSCMLKGGFFYSWYHY